MEKQTASTRASTVLVQKYFYLYSILYKEEKQKQTIPPNIEYRERKRIRARAQWRAKHKVIVMHRDEYFRLREDLVLEGFPRSLPHK